jgi:hypothetical protein
MADRPYIFFELTERRRPYDCGLCPDHEQHSCLALVEITDHYRDTAIARMPAAPWNQVLPTVAGVMP